MNRFDLPEGSTLLVNGAGSTAVLTELARLVRAGSMDPHVTDVPTTTRGAGRCGARRTGPQTGKVVLIP
jgi:hypothetical protein